MRVTRVCVLFTFSVVMLLGCHGSDARLGEQTVRIAIHRDPITSFPVRISQNLGYYRRENIKVELSEVGGGSKALEALLGGSVDVAVGSVSDVILLAAQGHQVRCFYLLYTRPIVALGVAPGLIAKIRSIRDLKGHTIGVSASGSASQQILNFLLSSNGLSPNDVSTVAVGMSSSSVAALEHGTVDAGILIGSAITNFEDRHPDSRFLADTRTAAATQSVFGSEDLPSLALVAKDEWLRTNPDTARRLVRAVRDGMRWMKENSPEQIREAIPESARMSAASSDYRAIRDTQQVVSPNGIMTTDGPLHIAHLLDVSGVHVGNLDVSRLYTNEFVTSK